MTSVAAGRLNDIFTAHACLDPLKYTRGHDGGPVLGLLIAQGVQHDGGRVADLHIHGRTALNHGLAAEGVHDPHLFLGLAAVIVAEAAVVGGDDEQGILGKAALFVHIPDAADVAVLDGDLLQVLLGTVAIVVACAVHLVELDEQEFGIVLLQIRADLIAQGAVRGGILMDVQPLLDDARVDGVPVTEGGQLAVGVVLTNDAEYAGEGRLRIIGNAGGDTVGESVKIGGNAVEHGTPALGADGGDGRVGVVGHRSAFENAINMGGGSLSEEIARTVNADESDSLVGVHGFSPFQDEFAD